MPSPTRGPLPAHVYRRRRLVVITVAVLLVLGIGRVLSGSSDGSGGGGDKAVQAAADSTPSAEPTDKKTKKNKNKNKNKGKKTPTPTPTPTPLAEPSGPCPDADVTITPSVPDPVAGRDVTVLLNLQTGTTEACTWHVSSDTVTLTISDDLDDIWASRECPHVIPSTDVVVRRGTVTPVPVVWDAKRSDEYCTNRTAWVLPGVYTFGAAAFGGEGTEVSVELTAPAAEVVTQTVQPTQKPDKGTKGNNKNTGNTKPRD